MVLQRRGGGNLGLYLLAAQIMNFGLENIPPVTLGLLAGQIGIFLNLFHKYFPSARAVCISPYLVLEHRDWRRIILSQFFHGDDMHLYFNMGSLLSKGTMLERKFGSVYFAYLVSVFTALTGITYVGLGFVLDTILSDQSYYLSCAVGFSGVLFALKVLAIHFSPPGMHYAMGYIPVPSKYIFWVELVLIQLVTPNASFVGHLAGILVGLMYTQGPLRPLMDSFLMPGGASNVDSSPPANRLGRGSRSSLSFTDWLFGSETNVAGHTSGYSNVQHPPIGGARNSPSAPQQEAVEPPQQPHSSDRHLDNQGHRNSFDPYTGGLSEEEQLRRAMEESARQSGQPKPSSSSSSQRTQGLYPELNDLRNRRANFYS